MATVNFNIAGDMNLFQSQSQLGDKYVGDTNVQFVGINSKNTIGYLGEFSGYHNFSLVGHIDKVYASPIAYAIPTIEITNIAVEMNQVLSNAFYGGRVQDQLAILLSQNDTLIGSSGDDGILAFDGNDVLIGGAGADYLDGGTGNNTASYSTAKAGLFAGLEDTNANTGDAAGDTYANIQNLIGSSHNDILYGTSADNKFSGGSGDDLFVGKGGADKFSGGAGSDTVGYDADFNGAVVDLLNPSRNTSTAAGDTYSSIENIDGSSNNDVLYGDNNANIIASDVYSDTPSGDDKLYGRGGNDTLKGYDGNDTLIGGAGIDKLFGGTDADTFVFSTGDSGKTMATADTIYDFTSADHIRLTSWDANSTKSSTQDFSFIGTHVFTGHAGELRYVKASSDTWIEGDTNGDKRIDFYIHLDDAFTLKAAYFEL